MPRGDTVRKRVHVADGHGEAVRVTPQRFHAREKLGANRDGLSHNDPAKRRGTSTAKDTSSPVANGWSRTGTLFTQDTNTIINLQAGPKGDVPAKTYTVTFFLRLSDEAAAADAVIQCQAEIRFATGGNDVTRVVSVQNGLTISGHAQMTRVIVSDVTRSGSAGPAPADLPYKVMVLVSEGLRPTLPYPPTLMPPWDISPFAQFPGGFSDIEVPQNAGVSSVMVSVVNNNVISGGLVASIPEQQAAVMHISDSGGAGNVLKAYDCRSADWVPLAPGTTFVRVKNCSAALNMTFTLVWGIDG